MRARTGVDMPRHLQRGRVTWSAVIPVLTVAAVFGAWAVASLMLAGR